ncbi:uncharacterized protein LOC117290414 [Asterias rubens]|uniref:uncharacterized protein LOC117290414 n=1 Tax=Asterias rubens TaxID=7604 RepID=UPI00145585A4|nr:uncharacterized protein LOC117290414 [Asterias rubens]XP_033627699.1 uncharacterized protein LOC117290414 [Asterias rubens]
MPCNAKNTPTMQTVLKTPTKPARESQPVFSNLSADFWQDVADDGLMRIHSISPLRDCQNSNSDQATPSPRKRLKRQRLIDGIDEPVQSGDGNQTVKSVSKDVIVADNSLSIKRRGRHRRKSGLIQKGTPSLVSSQEDTAEIIEIIEGDSFASVKSIRNSKQTDQEQVFESSTLHPLKVPDNPLAKGLKRVMTELAPTEAKRLKKKKRIKKGLESSGHSTISHSKKTKGRSKSGKTAAPMVVLSTEHLAEPQRTSTNLNRFETPKSSWLHRVSTPRVQTEKCKQNIPASGTSLEEAEIMVQSKNQPGVEGVGALYQQQTPQISSTSDPCLSITLSDLLEELSTSKRSSLSARLAKAKIACHEQKRRRRISLKRKYRESIGELDVTQGKMSPKEDLHTVKSQDIKLSAPLSNPNETFVEKHCQTQSKVPHVQTEQEVAINKAPVENGSDFETPKQQGAEAGPTCALCSCSECKCPPSLEIQTSGNVRIGVQVSPVVLKPDKLESEHARASTHSSLNSQSCQTDFRETQTQTVHETPSFASQIPPKGCSTLTTPSDQKVELVTVIKNCMDSLLDVCSDSKNFSKPSQLPGKETDVLKRFFESLKLVQANRSKSPPKPTPLLRRQSHRRRIESSESSDSLGQMDSEEAATLKSQCLSTVTQLVKPSTSKPFQSPRKETEYSDTLKSFIESIMNVSTQSRSPQKPTPLLRRQSHRRRIKSAGSSDSTKQTDSWSKSSSEELAIPKSHCLSPVLQLMKPPAAPGEILPKVIPLNFMKFSRHCGRRPIGKRVPQELFSSSGDSDSDVGRARAAAQRFINMTEDSDSDYGMGDRKVDDGEMLVGTRQINRKQYRRILDGWSEGADYVDHKESQGVVENVSGSDCSIEHIEVEEYIDNDENSAQEVNISVSLVHDGLGDRESDKENQDLFADGSGSDCSLELFEVEEFIDNDESSAEEGSISAEEVGISDKEDNDHTIVGTSASECGEGDVLSSIDNWDEWSEELDDGDYGNPFILDQATESRLKDDPESDCYSDAKEFDVTDDSQSENLVEEDVIRDRQHRNITDNKVYGRRMSPRKNRRRILDELFSSSEEISLIGTPKESHGMPGHLKVSIGERVNDISSSGNGSDSDTDQNSSGSQENVLQKQVSSNIVLDDDESKSEQVKPTKRLNPTGLLADKGKMLKIFKQQAEKNMIAKEKQAESKAFKETGFETSHHEIDCKDKQQEPSSQAVESTDRDEKDHRDGSDHDDEVFRLDVSDERQVERKECTDEDKLDNDENLDGHVKENREEGDILKDETEDIGGSDSDDTSLNIPDYVSSDDCPAKLNDRLLKKKKSKSQINVKENREEGDILKDETEDIGGSDSDDTSLNIPDYVSSDDCPAKLNDRLLKKSKSQIKKEKQSEMKGSLQVKQKMLKTRKQRSDGKRTKSTKVKKDCGKTNLQSTSEYRKEKGSNKRGGLNRRSRAAKSEDGDANSDQNNLVQGDNLGDDEDVDGQTTIDRTEHDGIKDIDADIGGSDSDDTIVNSPDDENRGVSGECSIIQKTTTATQSKEVTEAGLRRGRKSAKGPKTKKSLSRTESLEYDPDNSGLLVKRKAKKPQKLTGLLSEAETVKNRGVSTGEKTKSRNTKEDGKNDHQQSTCGEQHGESRSLSEQSLNGCDEGLGDDENENSDDAIMTSSDEGGHDDKSQTSSLKQSGKVTQLTTDKQIKDGLLKKGKPPQRKNIKKSLDRTDRQQDDPRNYAGLLYKSKSHKKLTQKTLPEMADMGKSKIKSVLTESMEKNLSLDNCNERVDNGKLIESPRQSKKMTSTKTNAQEGERKERNSPKSIQVKNSCDLRKRKEGEPDKSSPLKKLKNKTLLEKTETQTESKKVNTKLARKTKQVDVQNSPIEKTSEDNCGESRIDNTDEDAVGTDHQGDLGIIGKASSLKKSTKSKTAKQEKALKGEIKNAPKKSDFRRSLKTMEATEVVAELMNDRKLTKKNKQLSSGGKSEDKEQGGTSSLAQSTKFTKLETKEDTKGGQPKEKKTLTITKSKKNLAWTKLINSAVSSGKSSSKSAKDSDDSDYYFDTVDLVLSVKDQDEEESDSLKQSGKVTQLTTDKQTKDGLLKKGKPPQRKNIKKSLDRTDREQDDPRNYAGLLYKSKSHKKLTQKTLPEMADMGKSKIKSVLTESMEKNLSLDNCNERVDNGKLIESPRQSKKKTSTKTNAQEGERKERNSPKSIQVKNSCDLGKRKEGEPDKSRPLKKLKNKTLLEKTETQTESKQVKTKLARKTKQVDVQNSPIEKTSEDNCGESRIDNTGEDAVGTDHQGDLGIIGKSSSLKKSTKSKTAKQEKALKGEIKNAPKKSDFRRSLKTMEATEVVAELMNDRKLTKKNKQLSSGGKSEDKEQGGTSSLAQSTKFTKLETKEDTKGGQPKEKKTLTITKSKKNLAWTKLMNSTVSSGKSSSKSAKDSDDSDYYFDTVDLVLSVKDQDEEESDSYDDCSNDVESLVGKLMDDEDKDREGNSTGNGDKNLREADDMRDGSHCDDVGHGGQIVTELGMRKNLQNGEDNVRSNTDEEGGDVQENLAEEDASKDDEEGVDGFDSDDSSLLLAVEGSSVVCKKKQADRGPRNSSKTAEEVLEDEHSCSSDEESVDQIFPSRFLHEVESSACPFDHMGKSFRGKKHGCTCLVGNRPRKERVKRKATTNPVLTGSEHLDSDIIKSKPLVHGLLKDKGKLLTIFKQEAARKMMENVPATDAKPDAWKASRNFGEIRDKNYDPIMYTIKSDTNRAICEGLITPMPLEWEEPLISSKDREDHQSALRSIFYDTLLKRGRKNRIAARRRSGNVKLNRCPTIKEIKKANTAEKRRLKKLEAEVKSDGWIEYDMLPAVYPETDETVFIKAIK